MRRYVPFKGRVVRDMKRVSYSGSVCYLHSPAEFFLGVLLKTPKLLKEMNGTVSLTSIGMFGDGGGWGIPASNHTLQITLGGISKKPVLVNGQLENHEFLCVTISIDHDLVDGAPAARFIQRLKELVEGGYGMAEFTK